MPLPGHWSGANCTRRKRWTMWATGTSGAGRPDVSSAKMEFRRVLPALRTCCCMSSSSSGESSCRRTREGAARPQSLTRSPVSASRDSTPCSYGYCHCCEVLAVLVLAVATESAFHIHSSENAIRCRLVCLVNSNPGPLTAQVSKSQWHFGRNCIRTGTRSGVFRR